MVFDYNCMTNITGNETFCGAAPIYGSLGFTGSESDVELISQNNTVTINGFKTTSDKYRGRFCLLDICKFTEFYSATEIYNDTLMYDSSSGEGTIGLGLKSNIWEAYTV